MEEGVLVAWALAGQNTEVSHAQGQGAVATRLEGGR